jgi:hypothetical protein
VSQAKYCEGRVWAAGAFDPRKLMLDDVTKVEPECSIQ